MSKAERYLQRASVALAIFGILVAGYLTFVHYSGAEATCIIGAGGGCERVQTSQWATLLGVPVALLGLGNYLAIFLSLVFMRGDLRLLVSSTLAISGFLFSAYLQYRSIFSIKATCQWCLASSALMALLAITTAWRALLPRPNHEPSAGQATETSNP